MDAFGEMVLSILHSTWLSILVDGVLDRLFWMLSGVREGDPLSPLLFITTEEVFSKILQHIMERGDFGDLGQDEVVLSHLTYST